MSEEPTMIIIHDDVPVILLALRREAVVRQLRRAYRQYYAAFAGQKSGDAQAIVETMVVPLEEKFQEIEEMLRVYVQRRERDAEAGGVQ